MTPKDKLDRALCSAYVGVMIRIDLTRFSLSLALLGELITLAVHPRTRERLLAIFRIAQGDSAATVCRELQRDHHTVLKWAHDFHLGGPSALVYKHSGGTPSQLCSLAPLLVDVVEESCSLAALSRLQKKHQRSGSARQSGRRRRHQADRSGNDSSSNS